MSLKVFEFNITLDSVEHANGFILASRPEEADSILKEYFEEDGPIADITLEELAIFDPTLPQVLGVFYY